MIGTKVFMRPTFLYIGADKSGSSWLYEVLAAHPECFVPPAKDIYFFDRYYHRGLDWYFSLFKNAPPTAKAIGELSHDYLFSREAAARIAHDLPDIKLLTSLRDPVERTFSHYLYLLRSGLTREPFEVALQKFPELTNKSFYAKYLIEYVRRFDRSKIKVMFFDELTSDARAYAGEVFNFLGLRNIEEITFERHILPASAPRSFVLARMAKAGATVARDLGFPNLVGRVKRGPLRDLLYQPYEAGKKPVMAEETKMHLTQIFEPDIRQLEHMLSTDLSHWLAKN